MAPSCQDRETRGQETGRHVRETGVRNRKSGDGGGDDRSPRPPTTQRQHPLQIRILFFRFGLFFFEEDDTAKLNSSSVQLMIERRLLGRVSRRLPNGGLCPLERHRMNLLLWRPDRCSAAIRTRLPLPINRQPVNPPAAQSQVKAWRNRPLWRAVALPRLIPSEITPPANADGIQVQTSGPIHEAYAQPIDKNPPTVTVPKAAAARTELPPSEKPEGANVQVDSGLLGLGRRKEGLSVGKRRMAQHAPDENGSQATGTRLPTDGNGRRDTGAAASSKPQYLPQPPNSLEEGPSAPSPNENYFYIPGAWVMKDGQYVWRPGFWYPAQQDWTYVPPYYSYTPAGPVYVDGYWDYPFANRGTLFAPVTFDQPYWNNPGWCYQPNYAWDFGIGGPWNCLFVGAGFGHYFCGNFFSPFCFRNGFHPWYAFGARHFDPLFAHASWANRFNPGWMNGLHNNFWAR